MNPSPTPHQSKLFSQAQKCFSRTCIVFASEILKSGQNFLKLAFFQVPFYTLLFYCGYFNVLNHKNHIIIVILWENREKKTVYPLGIFSVPTYLPLPNHLPTLVPPCIPPTYPCLPSYRSPSSMGARARKQIKVWLKLHKYRKGYFLVHSTNCV